MSEAGHLWAALKALCARLDREEPDRIRVGLYLGLRLLAHPVLKCYRDDPTLTIDGEFPSLDALALAFERRLARNSPEVMAGEIGEIWGALYLPAEGRAVAIRLRAYVLDGEPDVIALRLLSPNLFSSVHAALKAARIQTNREDGRVLLDIEAEGMGDSFLSAVAGDSLGLPLALAFVSAFVAHPLPYSHGATGSIGRSGVDRIGTVGWIDKKRECLAERGVQLVVPPEVATLRQAWDLMTVGQLQVKGELEEPLTPLLGREREVLYLIRLLTQPDIRLITVTGPGGVGKTRLALHLLRSQLYRYSGGTWTLLLSEKTEDGEVKELFANVLGVSVDELPFRLAGRPTLLLLDNAESDPKATEKVRELLHLLPELVCLVTSRMVLGVRGEHRFDLEGLSLAEGTLLFSQRASAACSTYVEDPIIVGSIVQRLDGLPLAIELAASRVRMLSLPELFARLSRALSILSTRSQDLPERQRTIRATLEWSYRFLDSRERDVLQTLSIFADGFSEAAAIAVTGKEDVFEILVRLEEHSLLHYKEGRYRLLSLVREFAQEHLVSCGRQHVVADAHAAYYSGFLQEQRREARRIGQTEPIRALTRELGNLRATFTWLQESSDFRVLRFVADASNFLEIRGLEQEREAWIRAVLPLLSDDTPLDIVVLTLLPLARITRQRGDLEDSIQIVERLIRCTNDQMDSPWRAAVLSERSILNANQNNWDLALEDSEIAYDIHEKNGNVLGKMQAINKKGLVLLKSGNFGDAMCNFELALKIGTGAESIRDRVIIIENLIELNIEVGDATRALHFVRQQQGLRLALGDCLGVATTFYLCARALCLVGAFFEARMVLTAAFNIRKRHWRADVSEIERELIELGGMVPIPNSPSSDEEWLEWELPIPEDLRQAVSKKLPS